MNRTLTALRARRKSRIPALPEPPHRRPDNGTRDEWTLAA